MRKFDEGDLFRVQSCYTAEACLNEILEKGTAWGSAVDFDCIDSGNLYSEVVESFLLEDEGHVHTGVVLRYIGIDDYGDLAYVVLFNGMTCLAFSSVEPNPVDYKRKFQYENTMLPIGSTKEDLDKLFGPL